MKNSYDKAEILVVSNLKLEYVRQQRSQLVTKVNQCEGLPTKKLLCTQYLCTQTTIAKILYKTELLHNVYDTLYTYLVDKWLSQIQNHSTYFHVFHPMLLCVPCSKIVRYKKITVDHLAPTRSWTGIPKRYLLDVNYS